MREREKGHPATAVWTNRGQPPFHAISWSLGCHGNGPGNLRAFLGDICGGSSPLIHAHIQLVLTMVLNRSQQLASKPGTSSPQTYFSLPQGSALVAARKTRLPWLVGYLQEGVLTCHEQRKAAPARIPVSVSLLKGRRALTSFEIWPPHLGRNEETVLLLHKQKFKS